MALELALSLPLVALLAVALLSVAGLVRTSLVVHEAARVGARLAAVETDDDVVIDAAMRVAGPDAVVEVGPRRVHELVEVEVRTRVALFGTSHDVAGRSAAMVEPASRPADDG